MTARNLRLRQTGITLIEEDAWYQYLLDHARETPRGLVIVPFVLPEKAELRRRVLGRLTGLYREEEATLIAEVKKLESEWRYVKDKARRNDKIALRWRTGSLVEKVVWRMYQTLKNLIFGKP